MDHRLNKVFKIVVEILKQLRRNQNGFGNDMDRTDLITQNLTEEMLDDPDPTGTMQLKTYLRI